MRVAGVMSGTSLDGIDVAIVDITGRGWSKKIATVATSTTPYPKRVREAILGVSNREAHTGEIARLGFLLGELYAEAITDACRKHGVAIADVALIGCHGQTVFHEGQGRQYLGRRVASTLQLGEGGVVAERTGVPVISNFRVRDMAAGGKGAPLVPYVDYLLFRHARRGRVALNLGGIGNLTAIAPGASPDQVIAFDTGPGNMVIDALVQRHTGKMFDRGGRLAARGTVDRSLVQPLLRAAFYRAQPPKTAGREEYGEAFLNHFSALAPLDAIATATAFTAETVAVGIRRHVPWKVDDLIVAGGGAHNPVLMNGIKALLPGVAVMTTAELGISVDAKEAIAFAVLAYETRHGRPSNLPSATGAHRPVVLGDFSPA
ncbi:MAG: anhydro-N-acetylmuramic acid kinase [Bryobacteraceae bacterium]